MNAEKEFMNTFNTLTQRTRPFEVWRDFVTMAACSISNSVDKKHFAKREVDYMQIIYNKKYSKNELDLIVNLFVQTTLALEHNREQDFLGKIYMNIDINNSGMGQFFTPYSVCQCMAEMTLGDVTTKVKEKGYITINDCACGSGATLIASANEAQKQLTKAGLNFQNHILIAAQDLDYVSALMCYIQLSLLGVAAYIKIGNTLTEPIHPSDDLEHYWFTPMYFFDVWSFRRVFNNI